MGDQANVLRGLMEHRLATSALSQPIDTDNHPKARTIAVTSGKGGVGKSNIALNLSIALAQSGASVCLLDANLGLSNIDLLCGLNGYWNLSHVMTGARSLKDIVLQGPAGIRVIPGASGLTEVADCPPEAQQEILAQLEELEQVHDFILFDTATGIHRSIRRFLTAADVVLVLTTPELTSVADAYAAIKSLAAGECPEIQVLVNESESSQQVKLIVDRLQQTTRMFLHTSISSAGHVPYDPQVVRAVATRSPFVIGSPECPASRAVSQLARRLKNVAQAHPSRGAFFPRVWRRCLEKAA